MDEELSEICSMIYSRYFKAMINDGNIRSLSPSQITRMMNIIHLEGKIAGINTFKEKLKGTNEAYKYDIFIFKIQEQLSVLTNGLLPKDLFMEFCSLSEEEI